MDKRADAELERLPRYALAAWYRRARLKIACAPTKYAKLQWLSRCRSDSGRAGRRMRRKPGGCVRVGWYVLYDATRVGAQTWGLARGHAPRQRRTATQLHSRHASIGKPSPHGALGIDGDAPAPPLELPPPELPLDAELLAPPRVVVLGDAPMSLQYVGSWVQV